MNLFETVKSAVTVKQAAEYYGCNLFLRRLGGLGQLFAQGLGLAHIQILCNDLGGGLLHQLGAGQAQQHLCVAEAQLCGLSGVASQR